MAKQSIRKNGWSKDDTQLAALALPTTVWYVLFCYFPMFGVIIAFKEYQIVGGFLHSVLSSEWTGFKNFGVLFSNRDIWLIIRNTLCYNLVFIVLGIVLPVSLALVINELRNKTAAKIYQTILFIPYFLSWVVVSALVWAFLSYDMGLVNSILDGRGLDLHRFYMEKNFWPPFLVFMNFWKSIGYSMIIYLATLTSMDKTFYEAAVIDGATKSQQIWHLTLPMMKNVIILMFILSMGRIFYSDFGLFYQVPRDSNSIYQQVYTIDVFVYKQLKISTTGMAAAAALLQSSVSCLTILLTNWIVKKLDSDSAMI
ncbi:MAG: ABC transporter permease subunit [Treponema sp.]|jgi:putative aldouronate transport system permease protein|nr:ABC transporter permease subunit [Treponema sp.]